MKRKYTDIVIVRHGRTAWNKEGRVQGQCSVGLDDIGCLEAEESGRYLATGERCAAIYSSDLLRSLETAGKIAFALGLPINADPRLREISAGSWEGRIFDNISNKERAALSFDPHGYRFPGGETWKEVLTRAQRAIFEIASIHVQERVVIVTHGGPIRAVLSSWNYGSIESTPVPNGSITRLQWYEGASQPVIVCVGIVPFSNLMGEIGEKK